MPREAPVMITRFALKSMFMLAPVVFFLPVHLRVFLANARIQGGARAIESPKRSIVKDYLNVYVFCVQYCPWRHRWLKQVARESWL
jgi:hypothetical protein